MTSAQLRRQLRHARRGLSLGEQRAHRLAISQRLYRSRIFQRSNRIAFYLSTDAEIDLALLIRRSCVVHKACFLPVLRPGTSRALWFAEYHHQQILVRNRFGIREPPLKRSRIVDPWSLDLLLMPLVGFDLNGNRLGMGGGYYDRTLSYLRHRCLWRRPVLIGVAHECQKLGALKPEPWDIPLDAVITESKFYRFQSNTAPNIT